MDANILLRYLLRDDEAQAKRARRVIEGGQRVLVTDVVLAETLWTLSGRRYRTARADLVSVVDHLLRDPRICFEDNDVVWSALQAYRETDVDFADALIVHKALTTSVSGDELDVVYTFDAAALQLPRTAEP